MERFEDGIESRKMKARVDGPDMQVTVFDGLNAPRTFALGEFNKDCVTFGRDGRNDLVLTSAIVSREHGRFRLTEGGWVIEDSEVFRGRASENGLMINGYSFMRREIADGDLIRIDDAEEKVEDGVLMVFGSGTGKSSWSAFALEGEEVITVGRGGDCDIVLPHISVSKHHAVFSKSGAEYFVAGCEGAGGVFVNGAGISGARRLQEKDVVVIASFKLIFTSRAIYCASFTGGFPVDAEGVVVKRGKGRRARVTLNSVSLGVKPGELVAIIGGSGAGKSTLLNCMCGYLPPAQGSVFINGVDLYGNFGILKKQIGCVPQSDIVYDNLSLHDMLKYTAEMRLPADVSNEEREDAISRAIATVKLTGKEKRLIKHLSGGEKKRASIAVELISDPKIIFLDEPCSGLDPGTERDLMRSLREMADSGKTIVLVTHSTLQLSACDRVVFMGNGGNLCCFASLEDALGFFGVNDVVDVYSMLTEDPRSWREKFDALNSFGPVKRRGITAEVRAASGRHKPQLPVLAARYVKLIVNDRQRLLLLLALAPALALLVSLVANGKQFEDYTLTKSLLFALSCCAFYVGLQNAIQEVCKERSILRREYMAGLSLNAYVLSKLAVLGAFLFIQSAAVIAVFALAVGNVPGTGVFLPGVVELFITTFLTALSSAAMGLAVSSLFNNPDRVMAVVPVLLLPQVLFSGLIFKLKGASKVISWFVISRWSMEALGSTANLNSLPGRVGEIESFYEYSVMHMLGAWGMLILFTLVFSAAARLLLRGAGKEKQ